jgi:hypothetical protein
MPRFVPPHAWQTCRVFRWAAVRPRGVACAPLVASQRAGRRRATRGGTSGQLRQRAGAHHRAPAALMGCRVVSLWRSHAAAARSSRATGPISCPTRGRGAAQASRAGAPPSRYARERTTLTPTLARCRRSRLTRAATRRSRRRSCWRVRASLLRDRCARRACGTDAGRQRTSGRAVHACAPCCDWCCRPRPADGATTRATWKLTPTRLPFARRLPLSPCSCPQAESPAAQLDPSAHGQHHPVRGHGSAHPRWRRRKAWCESPLRTPSLTLAFCVPCRFVFSPALQVQRQAAPLAPHEAGHLSVQPLGMRRGTTTAAATAAATPPPAQLLATAPAGLLRCGRTRRAGDCAGVAWPPATDHTDFFSDTRDRAA